MIETSQLQTLVAVARKGSFSKAAEELLVTQSAISQSIKNLEKRLGLSLFKRSGKKVLLTLEGQQLFEFAKEFIKQMDDVLENLQEIKGEMKGPIRLGTLTGVGKSWLAPRMLEFSQAYPDLKVSTHLGFGEDLIRDFNAYRLDILILPEESLPNTGEKIFLSEERSTLVFPNTDEFPISKNIGLNELSQFPTVLFEKSDPLYYGWCKQRFGKVPKDVNVRYSINSHGNMLQAVQKGLGVAVVPVHVLGRSYYKDKVGSLGKEFELTNSRFFIVYQTGSNELLRIQKCIEFLKQSVDPFARR